MQWLVQYRRVIGLFAFFYATLHLLTYLVLDQSFNLERMSHDILKRPFILLGTLTWLILLPLAVTSTQAAIRRLGKRWASLHRWVYVVRLGMLALFLVSEEGQSRSAAIRCGAGWCCWAWRVVLWAMKRRELARA